MTPPTIAAPRAETEAPAPLKASARQVYCIAHLACDLLAVPYPSNRREASELIQRLRDTLPKPTTAVDGEAF